MHLRTLRAFVAVVQEGGFSQAAKVVCTTQSSVSKSIKSLEERIGQPLFERNKHRLRLTPAGEIVYRRAQAILAERDGLVADLRALAEQEHGVLRLGLPMAGGALRFAPLYAAYRQRYPDIKVELVEDRGERLREMLLAGELDVAALLAPAAPAPAASEPAAPPLAMQEAGREPLVAIVARGHTLAGKASVTLEQLALLPLILYEPGAQVNPVVLDAYARRALVPQVAARSAQIDFIVELVARAMGVALMPVTLARHYEHLGVVPLRLDAPELDLRTVFAWSAETAPTPALRAWLDLARSMTADATAA